MAPCVLFVLHADRGHFNFCLPLARELVQSGVRCELWTNTPCSLWVRPGCFESVRTDFGATGLPQVTAAYKLAVSHGDTDAEGQENLWGDPAAMGAVFGAAPWVPEHEGPQFGHSPLSERGAVAFKQRLAEAEVAGVVFEGVWGRWARDVAEAVGKPSLGLMPSFICPFRAAYCAEPVRGSDGQCIVRNRPEDINSSFADCPPDAAAYVIAQPLVGLADGGRLRFGAFLPDARDAEFEDEELRAWLDGESLPAEQRAVTLIALGSQSALSSLAATAERDMLQGCLHAAPRVLVASAQLPEDQGLKDAVAMGRLRSMAFVPQWAVLCHPNVNVFVSHAGANSTHEALAAGHAAIVPLPFFDDQHYIAARLEALYGYAEAAVVSQEQAYAPLRKSVFRCGGAAAVEQVAAAVRVAMKVLAERRRALQEGVLEERGCATAAQAIVARFGLAQVHATDVR